MNAQKVARLCSWTDVVFGGIPIVIALIYIEMSPCCVPVLSWLVEAIAFEGFPIYSLTAAMAGTMTSISMAVTMLAVQMWRADWFRNMMRDAVAVQKLWLTMRQFTWGMASFTAVCVFAMFIDPNSTLGQYVAVIYVGWLGAAMSRMFRAIIYIHLMVNIAVTAIAAISNDGDIE